MGNLLCVGLFLRFCAIPTPRRADDADDRLSASMDMDMLHRDLLLALAAMAVEGFEQGGIGAGQLVGLGKVLATPFEGLFAEHGAPVAFHRGVVGGDQLRRHHAFEFVPRPDPDQRGNRGAQLLVAFVRALVLHPERLHGLVGEDVVPTIRSRAANVLQPALAIVRIVGDHGGRCVGGGVLGA